MIIKNATFIISAASPYQFVKSEKPIIAVAGKSNVGKSTFINMIANYFSDEDKLKSVIKLMENDSLIKSSCENDRDVITYDKFNEYLNNFNSKILNIESNEKYNEDIIKSLTKKYGSEVYSLDYYYNIEFKNNGLDISGPCDNLGQILPNYRIINTSKDDKSLIIYAKIYFSSIGFIYKDYAEKNVIYEATIENNFIVDDNLDEFDTYKYTFKMDNGNYSFVSLEKIK